MLAPLENRAILEKEPAEPQSALERENAALRRALQKARSSQKRMITLNAARSIEQANRIAVLETQSSNLRARIAQLESGQAIIELGRQLMELREANEQLIVAAQRVWHLDKTICAAHRECERLARERDDLAFRLCQHASHHIEH
ncbi:hypothetical protein [Azonexus hydrophilus]|uniref:Uncharacterized protein n=1 Tax=Azonexus hydrophilus TaxID=418702 RepID=A0ABZ2XI49_9RHOO|nr:hypothetical protein [Azonexus hydrophilus]